MIERIIIHDVHEQLGDNPKANALAAHRGRKSTYQKLPERKKLPKLSRAMKTF